MGDSIHYLPLYMVSFLIFVGGLDIFCSKKLAFYSFVLYNTIR